MDFLCFKRTIFRSFYLNEFIPLEERLEVFNHMFFLPNSKEIMSAFALLDNSDKNYLNEYFTEYFLTNELMYKMANIGEWTPEQIKRGFRNYIQFMRNAKQKEDNDMEKTSILDIVDPFYDGHKELLALRKELYSIIPKVSSDCLKEIMVFVQSCQTDSQQSFDYFLDLNKFSKQQCLSIKHILHNYHYL